MEMVSLRLLYRYLQSCVLRFSSPARNDPSDNTNVLISKVKFLDFEVAAVSLNNVNSLGKIDNK